ncbi:hypothetical protein ACA910_005801 [Epithemia clementina (nom. ined.)]
MVGAQEMALHCEPYSTTHPERFSMSGEDVSFSRKDFAVWQHQHGPVSDRARYGRRRRTAFPRPLLWRIEENILLKLAVKRLQQEESEQQQRQLDESSVHNVDDSMSVSDWEITLFAPLAQEPTTFFGVEIHNHHSGMAADDHASIVLGSHNQTKSLGELTAATEADSHMTGADAESHAAINDSDYSRDPDFQPVHVEWEDPLDLISCPRILSQALMQYLNDNGIPESLQGNRWERCFAIGRDGDSFVSFLDRCAPYRQTLLVVQTTEGHVLGGFAMQTWEGQEGFGKRNCYYGTGQSFLFSITPEDMTHPTGSKAQIYKWTGTNDYCQICDVESAKIAMGGGGDFGIIVEDCFLRGQTGFCGTYDNPPLTADGFFEVAALEVYGLVPLFQSFHSTSSTISSICREVQAILKDQN